jgi:hypothetical protein
MLEFDAVTRDWPCALLCPSCATEIRFQEHRLGRGYEEPSGTVLVIRLKFKSNVTIASEDLMKKWIIALIAFVGLSSGASAIGFSVGGGLGYGFSSGSGSALQGTVQFTVKDLLSFGPLGLDVRTSVNVLIASSTSVGVNVAPLLTFVVDPLRLYAGPSVGINIVPGSGVTLGAVAGLEYPISPNLRAFAEANVDFVPATFFTVRAGVNFNF